MCGGSRGSSTVAVSDPIVSRAEGQGQTESAARIQTKKQRNKGGNSSNMVSMDRNQLGGGTIMDAAIKKELG